MYQKFLQKRVDGNLKSMMSSDRNIRRTLNSSDKKDAVKEIMMEQKITDLAKLSANGRKAFNKAISGIKGMNSMTRRAFSQAIETQRPVTAKINEVSEKKPSQSLHEVLNKRNDISKTSENLHAGIINAPREDSKVVNFSSSSKGLRASGNLFVHARSSHDFYDDKRVQEASEINEIRDRLKNIQE